MTSPSPKPRRTRSKPSSPTPPSLTTITGVAANAVTQDRSTTTIVTMAADLTEGGIGVAVPVDPDGPDGIRMTWNAWPRSKVEVSKCVLPVVVSIAPIRASPSLLVLPYALIRCKPPCAAVFNPFAHVDFTTKIWNCPLCFSRNYFPPHNTAISEIKIPSYLW